MSVTGMLLLMFLIIHLIENILIFESKQAFNEWAHFLTGTMAPYIYAAEFGLAALFVLHIVTAVQLHKVNREARPHPYEHVGRAGHTSRKTILSSNMIWTGTFVLLFVCIHLYGLKFGTHYETDTHIRDMHRLVVESYSDPAVVIMYVAFMMLLGLHLVHAIHSAFQTLGIPHRMRCMRATQGLALLLAAGFGLMPILVYFLGDKLS